MGEIRKLLNSQYFFVHCLNCLWSLVIKFYQVKTNGYLPENKEKKSKIDWKCLFFLYIYIETAQHTIVYFVIENTKQTM